jgi:hypothetical protein
VASLVTVLLALLAAGASGAHSAPDPCRSVQPVLPRSPAEYVPDAAGIWLKRVRHTVACVGVVPRGSVRARIVLADPRLGENRSGEVLVAPGAGRFVYQIYRFDDVAGTLADPRTFDLVDVASGAREPRSGQALAYTASGALVAWRDRGAVLVDRSGERPLVSAAALAAAAGFVGRPRPTGFRQYGTYGRGVVAVPYELLRPFRATVLLIGLDGSVRRIAPVATRQVEGAIGELYWSPDGSTLLMANARPPKPGSRYGHDHCLDRWRAVEGYRRLWCVSAIRLPRGATGHFTALLWSRDGRTALLNDSVIIDRNGAITGERRPGAKAAFAIAWASEP